MVQLSIKVRSKSSYAKAGKIKTLTVDSSQRLEEIVESGSLLYSNGRELPLNSSFASNNAQEGDILESCSSPLMSSLLSAVLQDLNSIERLPEHERTQEKIQPLLGGALLDPWPDRWSFDSMKTRKICLATMKMVLQRDGRFNLKQVPKLSTLQEVYDFMQTVWNSGNGNRRRGHNSMAHVFKPSAKNSNGKPSICWQLMDHKFQQAHQLRMTTDSTSVDWIEAFVQRENGRHNRAIETPPTITRRNNRSASKATPRQRRRLQPSPASRRTSATTTPCMNCNQLAECTCLEESCPFYKQLCCPLCFIGNHPRHIRNHQRVELTDPRVKTVLKERNKPGYCPEYQSGPFALLSTLSEASEGGQSGHARREFSLSESRLKKIAQTRCRSNLYDRQARGRSAFACIESLADKQLVRKELMPGQAEARFSLLPAGEAMAKLCRTFETSLDEVLREKTLDVLRQPYRKEDVSIIVDSREDATYAKRLLEHCQDRGLPCANRELPAGDYLFVTKPPNDEEKVLPLVIERKSWSDLADSVSGSGKGHRRLDCVRIDGDGVCSTGRCQLCRMKASGCSKVMFIIEGARCLNRDGENKCNNTKRCKYCKELQERHNLSHEELEEVLYQLQAKHGCLLHFTRGYNETIVSLQIMHRILVSNSSSGDDPQLAQAIQISQGGSAAAPLSQDTNLSYAKFCSNARRSRCNDGILKFFGGAKKGRVRRVGAESFIRSIRDDKVVSIFASDSAGTQAGGVENLDRAFSSTGPVAGGVEVVEIDSDDDRSYDASQNSIILLDEDPSWTSAKASSNLLVEVDSDGSEEPPIKQRGKNVDVLVLDDDAGERCGADANKSVPFFVLSGMYEYDTDYFHDVNKVWQSAYRSEASKSRNNFRVAVLDQLRSIQTDQLPLVKRESMLYWALKIQLRNQVLLHAARSSECINQLQHHWNFGGRAIGTRCNVSDEACTSRLPTSPARSRRTAQQTSSQRTPVYSIDDDPEEVPRSPRHRHPEKAPGSRPTPPPQASPKTTPVYTIDDDPEPVRPTVVRGTPESGARRQASPKETPIYTIDDDPIPVPQPARRKAREISRRQTPAVAGMKKAPVYTIDGDPEPASYATEVVAKEARRKASPRSDGNKTTPNHARQAMPSDSQTDAKIREARLRRFGNTQSPRSTGIKRARVSDPDQWSCKTCTVLNEVSSTNCKVCNAKQTNAWACDKCSYENCIDVTRCTICDCVNKKRMLDTSDHLEVSRLPILTSKRGMRRGERPPRPPADVVSIRKGPRPPPTKSAKWACQSCTYENDLILPSCQMCDSRNPSIAVGLDFREKGVVDASPVGSSRIPSTERVDNSHRRGEGGVPYDRSPQVSATRRGEGVAHLGKSTKASSALPDEIKSAFCRPKSRVRCGACGQDGHNRATGKQIYLFCSFFRSQFVA